MTPHLLSPIADHIWQSTVFAFAAALIALMLRKNRAQVRYLVWLVASLKFLVPFSLLVTVGGLFEWNRAPAVAPPLAAAVEQISQPFTAGQFVAVATPAEPAVSSFRPALLTAVWLAGITVVLAVWWVRWRRLRTALRAATPLPIEAPVKVMSTPTLLEPGVFGIFRPVLLLPSGIAARLTPAQMRAILAHELCHIRRRDNLPAAIHMFIEAVFWFHPLVWWIGTRMVAERERACDEEVVRLGNEPAAYAEGILNVCKFYLESPLACASGVTGADLKKRIEAIMTERISHRLSLARKLLLTAAGTAAVVAPLLIGIMNAPHSRAQSAPPLRFEVASIKPASPTDTLKARLELLPGGGLKVGNVSVKSLITFAYDVPESRVSGGPGWLESQRYDIVAKAEQTEGSAAVANYQGRAAQNQARERLRTLLAERFNLAIHKDTREGPVLALVVAKSGFKIQPSKQSEDIPPGTMRSATQINARRGTMQMLSAVLTNWLRRPVVDQTGLTGNYDYVLKYAADPGEAALFPPEENPTDGSGPSVYTALQEQLGLKLESRKGRLEVIVIDRVEKPSEN